jgi:nitrogen fixation NifU-like protein
MRIAVADNEYVHSPQLLDHFENPRHAGELDAPAVKVDVMNPVCGDMLRLSAECEEGVITRAAFKAKGCTACLAMGSALAELLTGRARGQLRQLRAADIDQALGGLINESKHVAQLALDAVKALDAKLGPSGPA